jgi:branched-subunit amino acid aminotransferase/4-amino-4-deoxychorismate lyase
MPFWYNGQPQTTDTIQLSLTDPGLLYGATVFSTLRVYSNNLADPQSAWHLHRDRLKHSLQTFGWTEPNWERLQTGALWLAQTDPVLRLTVFPDGREWITGRALPNDLPERQTQGIRAWVATGLGARSLPHHKTGNYLTPWLGLQQLQQRQVQEAILTNDRGHWLETLTGNLWGWVDNRWWTPSLEVGILPGITRQRLLHNAQSHHKIVSECIWDNAFVDRLEALAYSNSVVEIIPIRQVIWGDDITGSNALPFTRYDSSYNPTHPALEELRQLLVSSHSEMG